jgi:hypothetical protein
METDGQDAIDAANAGNGGTITLLDDVNVTEQFTITKPIVINGKNGDSNHKITASAAANKANLFTAQADLTLQSVDITYTNTGKAGSIVYSLETAVTVTVTNCYLDSTNVAIHMQNQISTAGTVVVSGSTLISNDATLVLEGSTCNITIENQSKILARNQAPDYSSAAFYYLGDNAKGTLNVTNSVISGKRHLFKIRRSANPTITLGQGAIVDKNWAGLADYGITDLEDAQTFYFHDELGTIIMEGNAYISQLDLGAVALTNRCTRFSFSENYNGTQIIRQSGNTYFFYDDVATAMSAAAAGDTVFTYSEVTADAAKAKGYTVAEENGYYKISATTN